MADQADDLSIPTNPAPPMAGVTVPPPRIADLSRPGAESANAPALSRGTDLPRPGAEPAARLLDPLPRGPNELRSSDVGAGCFDVASLSLVVSAI
jgi:hypothetical protein